MSFTDLTTLGMVATEKYATCREIVRLAFSNQAFYSQLHREDIWHFRSLLVDGDLIHNPAGAFAAVDTDCIASLSACNAGTKFFFALPHVSFASLQRITLTDCLLSLAGARVISHVVSSHDVKELGVHRCFLSSEDLSYFQAVAHKLSSFSITESGVSVNIAPALTSIISAENLQHLSVSGKLQLDAGIFEVIARHGSLRSLRILNNPLLSDSNVEGLCHTWCCNAVGSSLTCLDFSVIAGGGGTLTDTAGHAISRFLQAGAGITELRLAGHKMTCRALRACINQGNALELIDFTGMNLRDTDDDKVLCTAPVRTLLVGGFVEQDAYVDVDIHSSARATCLSSINALLHSLVVLNISKANVGDDALDVLCAAMANISRLPLRVLDLSENFITEDGAQSLVQALEKGQVRLQNLDMGINAIGDEGCSSIGLALRQGGALTSVSSLSLRANSISVIRDICGLLPSSTLQMLDLRENLLVDRDVQLLLAATRSSKASITLKLAGNEISESLWDDLHVTCEFTGSVQVGQRKVGQRKVSEGRAFEHCGHPEGSPGLQNDEQSVQEAVRENMVVHESPIRGEASVGTLFQDECNVLVCEPSSHDKVSGNTPDRAEHGVQQCSESLKDVSSAVVQGGQARGSVATEEWQDCLDLLEWAQSQLK